MKDEEKGNTGKKSQKREREADSARGNIASSRCSGRASFFRLCCSVTTCACISQQRTRRAVSDGACCLRPLHSQNAHARTPYVHCGASIRHQMKVVSDSQLFTREGEGERKKEIVEVSRKLPQKSAGQDAFFLGVSDNI